MKINIINLCLLTIFMASCSNDDSSFISLSSSTLAAIKLSICLYLFASILLVFAPTSLIPRAKINFSHIKPAHGIDLEQRRDKNGYDLDLDRDPGTLFDRRSPFRQYARVLRVRQKAPRERTESRRHDHPAEVH